VATQYATVGRMGIDHSIDRGISCKYLPGRYTCVAFWKCMDMVAAIAFAIAVSVRLLYFYKKRLSIVVYDFCVYQRNPITA
jgi:hypothetical protein